MNPIEALKALEPELRREMTSLDYKRNFLRQLRLQTILSAIQALSDDVVVVPRERLQEWARHIDNMEAQHEDYHNLGENDTPCRSPVLNDMFEALSAATPPAESEMVERGVKNSAYWTYDSEVGAYYFAPNSRTKPPYLKQIEVTATLDIASDGTLAGIELVDGNLPPPPAIAAYGGK